jgi:hypothetical protein
MNNETILKIVDVLDGHTIYEPESLIELGLSRHVAKAMTEAKESGLTHKQQLWDADGNPAN